MELMSTRAWQAIGMHMVGDVRAREHVCFCQSYSMQAVAGSYHIDVDSEVQLAFRLY